MGKRGFALLTLLALLWIPGVPWAGISEVRVGVDGMTCVT